MAGLIDQERRARARSERESRRRVLLETAREAFSSRPLTELTLDGISRRAGVPSGSAALLFATLEELFLAVADVAVAAWASELERALETAPAPIRPSSLIDLLVAALVERPDLTRLLGHLPAVVERPMDVEAVTSFLLRQNARLRALGVRLEASASATSSLSPGDGARILWGLWRACAGLEPYARPVGAMAVALLDDDLTTLRVEREVELTRAARALLASP
jgi:AcrR family transcriptional regulator